MVKKRIQDYYISAINGNKTDQVNCFGMSK